MKARLKTIAGYGQGDVLSLDGYDVVTIGRTRYNTIQVMERDVSRTHCRVERFGAVWRFADAGSRNGTLRNGEEEKSGILKRGDRLQIGHTTFEIELLPGTPSPADVSRESEVDETADSSAMFPSNVTTADSVATGAATPAIHVVRRPGFSWTNPVTLFVLAFLITMAIGVAMMHVRGGAAKEASGAGDDSSLSLTADE